MKPFAKYFLMLAIPSLALGTVFHVEPTGSIQATVNNAADEDTIVLHDGHYMETTVLYGKTLTIGSQFLLDGDMSHIAQTQVTPDAVRADTSSCFVYAYGEDRAGRLVGLTLSAGTGTWWETPANDYAGGAVFVWLSGVTLDYCIIQGSSAPYGGGIAAALRDYHIRTSLLLNNCTFRNNYASFWGGGCYANFCSLYVKNSTFEGNSSALQGGGIWIGKCYVEMDSCFVRNNSGMTGGCSLSGGRGWMNGCVFEGNGYDNDHAPGVSHLDLADSRVVVSGCYFGHNALNHTAITLQGLLGWEFTFVGNVVEENVATVFTGTMLISNGSQGEIAYNIFRHNVNIVGGTICCLSSNTARVHHNLFEGNVSQDHSSPSVVLSLSGARTSMDSNWVYGNTSPAVWHDSAGYPFVFHAENNYWGDPSGPYHPRLNPNGRGDTLLSDSVLFIPWLTASPDTHLPESVPRFERPEISATWKLVAVYPNPFNSSLRIILAGFAREDFRITLHNLLGQEIGEIHRGPLVGGELIYQAPSSLATGVYFVHASSRTNVETRKVVFLK